MNVEQLDGFLVALICCPSVVAKYDYLPEIRSHIRNQHSSPAAIRANGDLRLILI